MAHMRIVGVLYEGYAGFYMRSIGILISGF